jgi:hypothetical protein
VHLSPEEFVDVAEGARSDESLPHLAACDACRTELAAIRAALSNAVDGDVPEPSPLFWSQLSARVNGAIDADASSRRWWTAWLQPPVLMPLSAMAALVLVVALLPAARDAFRSTPRRVLAPAATPPAVDAVDPRDTNDQASDPLLAIVGDLSATMDLDTVADAGLAGQGSAERAVSRMNDAELRTLKQLLQAELGRPGA